ncbi:MAG: diaminopimelate epimerase, partial [Schwartzia sp.]|nr:diaminopimelate epimerase [Schwartzia sp. (in: firmicutes)]
MALAFTKWQGCGNDFVLVDGRASGLPRDAAGLSRRVCDRHYGIGADGLIFVLPSDKADFCMRIFNADGSEAEMCGNGIRCFARLVYEERMTEQESFTVETGAGILTPRIVKETGKIIGVEVNMGEPVLEAEKIPVTGFGNDRVVSEEIEVLGKRYRATCISMGNPHCVVFVGDVDDVAMETVGPAFERHDWFPRRTNTEFVVVRDREHLRMRVWERGAAVTLACGTGACASLVAAVLNGRAERKAEVEL